MNPAECRRKARYYWEQAGSLSASDPNRDILLRLAREYEQVASAIEHSGVYEDHGPST